MKKIQIIINEDGKLMGYCDYGNMENSIEIEIEDNFEFKPDIQNYTYSNGKLEYKKDLSEIKNIKREELKLIRDKLCKEDLNVNGSLFQVRNTEDTGKFERIILGLLLKTISPEQTEEWRLADNSYKTFTYGELSQIPKLYSDREREIFAKFKELDEKLEELNTVDEIMALKWV